MRRILLYRNGETAPEVVRDVGNYLDWFGRVLGDRARLDLHISHEEPRPALDRYDGIVLTGSPLSLVEPMAWMEEAALFVRDAAAAGVPVLGVCFGHQLVGWAWGGTVRENPRGWEAGTHEVSLTDEGCRDPLFHGLPARLHVNQSHRDEVAALGPDTVLLAGSDHSPHQAIAIGDHVRGVQFHPEMNAGVIRRIIQHRSVLLTDDAERRGRGEQWHAGALLSRAADTPTAEQVVLNFMRHFVEHA